MFDKSRGKLTAFEQKIPLGDLIMWKIAHGIGCRYRIRFRNKQILVKILPNFNFWFVLKTYNLLKYSQ